MKNCSQNMPTLPQLGIFLWYAISFLPTVLQFFFFFHWRKSNIFSWSHFKMQKKTCQNCSQFPLLAAVEGLVGAAKSPQSSKSEFEKADVWLWLGFTLDNREEGAVGGAAKSPSKLSTETEVCCCWRLITELSLLTARLPPETEVGNLLADAVPPGGGGNTTPPIDPLAEAALGRLVAPPIGKVIKVTFSQMIILQFCYLKQTKPNCAT